MNERIIISSNWEKLTKEEQEKLKKLFAQAIAKRIIRVLKV